MAKGIFRSSGFTECISWLCKAGTQRATTIHQAALEATYNKQLALDILTTAIRIFQRYLE
jgi:hypothetical protein